MSAELCRYGLGAFLCFDFLRMLRSAPLCSAPLCVAV